MRVEVYSHQKKEVWDSFISQSKNGTFLFYRDFMDYHAARFKDYSLLFYQGNNLIALLPGNLSDKTYYSHQGLSYGGLIMSKETRATEVIEIFEHLTISLSRQGIKEIVYKAIPHIYHAMPAEEDLYALFLHKATIMGRNISSTVLLTQRENYSAIRRRGIKKANENNLKISKSEDFHSFWNILEANLEKQHNTKPVHSLDEIVQLKDNFSSNILLFAAYNMEEKMIAGTVLFVTDMVVHLQYIASSEEGKQVGATDLLIDHILQLDWDGKTYFDYGISTENNGLLLNAGLIQHKEGFGMRAINYDIYSIKLG